MYLPDTSIVASRLIVLVPFVNSSFATSITMLPITSYNVTITFCVSVRVKLIVVDHPSESDVYVDERFTPPPYAPLKIYSVKDKQIPIMAVDQNDVDLMPQISQRDPSAGH